MWPLFVIQAVCTVFVIGCLWHFRCATKTYRDRKRLLKNCPATGAAKWTKERSDFFWQFHKELDAVSYDRHLKEYFCLRSPKKLYGPAVLAVWDEPLPDEEALPKSDNKKVIADAHAYYTALTEVE